MQILKKNRVTVKAMPQKYISVNGEQLISSAIGCIAHTIKEILARRPCSLLILLWIIVNRRSILTYNLLSETGNHPEIVQQGVLQWHYGWQQDYPQKWVQVCVAHCCPTHPLPCGCVIVIDIVCFLQHKNGQIGYAGFKGLHLQCLWQFNLNPQVNTWYQCHKWGDQADNFLMSFKLSHWSSVETRGNVMCLMWSRQNLMDI